MQRVDRATKNLKRIDEFLWLHFVWCKKNKKIISAFAFKNKINQFRQIIAINKINDSLNSKINLDKSQQKKQTKKKITKDFNLINEFCWQIFFDELSTKLIVFAKSFWQFLMIQIWKISQTIHMTTNVVHIVMSIKNARLKSSHVNNHASNN